MDIQPAGTYIEATYGRGGHTRALLDSLDDAGRVVGMDRDPEAVRDAEKLHEQDARFRIVKSPFSRIAAVADDFKGSVDGILFDLGISSPQVDDPRRGFSFRADGPLDMRMDPDSRISAADWLATASEAEISDVLWELGDERRSRQIARKIVETRKASPLTTTFELASLVRSCVFQRGSKIDPATRTFQAVRLRVNDELGELEAALDAALGLIAVGGRVLVIAFHSLEDRIVKRRFRDLDRVRRENERTGNSSSPEFTLLTRKPVVATRDQQRLNPRSRSARLRGVERTA